jgi:Xaa-Pro aminopeptidase
MTPRLISTTSNKSPRHRRKSRYRYPCIYESISQKEVTAVFVREIDHLNYLTIVDEQGREQVIETTDAHPFWVVTDEPDLERAARELVDENGVWLYHENVAPTENGFWVEAKDLRVGDVFIGANGELSTLVAIERVEFEENIKVYNFTVEGNHNYFVIAEGDEFGQTSVLVHNASGYGDEDDPPSQPSTPFSDILSLLTKHPALRLLGFC